PAPPHTQSPTAPGWAFCCVGEATHAQVATPCDCPARATMAKRELHEGSHANRHHFARACLSRRLFGGTAPSLDVRPDASAADTLARDERSGRADRSHSTASAGTQFDPGADRGGTRCAQAPA